MKSFKGETLRWDWHEGVLELTLDRPPANEIGTVMLRELEQFVAAAKNLTAETSACIISSAQKSGFYAGADLRELYNRAVSLHEENRSAGLREFLEGIHSLFHWLHDAPFVT